MGVATKRAYEEPSEKDGLRVLVDRLWPRGLTKEKAQIDLWLKDVAPSAELRKWFAHDPEKWVEFQKRYRAELREDTEDIARLKTEVRRGVVTLVYGARDVEHNDAVVLEKFLRAE